MAIYERQPDGSYAPQEVLSTTKTDNFTITYGPVEGLDGERLQLAKAFLKDIAEHNLRITSLEVNAGISGADDEIADIFEVPEGIKNSVDTNNTTSVWVSNKMYRNDYMFSQWDITSATYINSFYVGNQDGYPFGLFFKPDGTTMYIIGTNNGKVYKYDISFVQTTPQEKQLWIKYDKPKPQAVYLALYSGAFQEDEIGDVYFYFTDGTNNSILMNPWTIYSNLNLSFTPTHVVIVQKDTTVSKISKYVLLIAY